MLIKPKLHLYYLLWICCTTSCGLVVDVVDLLWVCYDLGTHDFLLTFSNHRPISHRFRDKWRFPSKIANFSYLHVFSAPAEPVPLGIGYRRLGHKKLE